MTSRIASLWVVMTLSFLACVLPVQVIIPTPVVMTAEVTPKNVMTAVVNAYQSLNVRVRPGEREAVIGYLYAADRVTLTGKCQSGWAQIVWRDGAAWVKASYLSENKCQTK